MKEFIICDQNGIPFTESDTAEFTDKQVKKVGYINNGFLCIKLDENSIEVKDGPTSDTKIVFSSIKDKEGNIKITDIFVVK